MHEEEIESKIEVLELSVSQTQELLHDGEIPSEQVHQSYFNLSGGYYDIGLYRLLIGEQSVARDLFEKSANYQLKAIESKSETVESNWESIPWQYIDALNRAILSNDISLMESTARAVRQNDSDYPREYPDTRAWFYYSQLLSTIILNDTARVRELIPKLEGTVEDLNQETQEHFNVRLALIKSLLDQDVSKLEQELQVLLDRHSSEFADEPESNEDAVCVPASIYLTLAEIHDCEPDINSDYIYM